MSVRCFPTPTSYRRGLPEGSHPPRRLPALAVALALLALAWSPSFPDGGGVRLLAQTIPDPEAALRAPNRG